MKRFWLSLPAAILVFQLSVSVVAGEDKPIGTINNVAGEVVVTKEDGKKVPAEEGLPLFPGDHITTGKKSMSRFSLELGGRFQLGEESQVSMDELSPSEVEDDYSILRLVVGYLRTKIETIRGRPSRLGIFTPTAVLGVRGTAFDTVVALDATSAFTVDEGRVEVTAEDEKVVLDAGDMTSVEESAKPLPPSRAVPREKRDWKSWRKERARQLLHRLPKWSPRFRKRFERVVFRSKKFTDRVNLQAEELRRSIREIRHSWRTGDRQRARQFGSLLKSEVKTFKKMVAQFRGAQSRVRVMGRFSHRVETFVDSHEDRFIKDALTAIQADFVIIDQKRMALKALYQKTIQNIRATFGELKALKREKEARKKGRGAKP